MSMVPALLRRAGLLSPEAIHKIISAEFGIDLDVTVVETMIKYARRAGEMAHVVDRPLATLEAPELQALLAAFDLKIDDATSESLVGTARGMITNPDETVRDLIASGKWKRLLALGPQRAPIRSSFITCSHCGELTLIRG